MFKKIIMMLATFLFVSIAHAKVHSGIEVTVSPIKANIGNDEDVYVKVSYKNRTNQTVKLLQWYLPDSEGHLEEGIFKVSLDGQPIDYLGAHYKRPAPVEADYLALKPHKKVTYTVELSRVYDISEQGLYKVEMAVENLALFSPSYSKGNKGNAATQMKSGNAAYLYITEKRSPKGKPCNPRKEDCGGGDGGTGGDVSFSGACSNSEQNSILAAVDAAKNMTNDSVSYLSGNTGPRYTTWFGEYTSSRWNKVAGNFDAIKDALDNKSKVFDCSCNQSYFAYVYPSQPYKVYLCRAFWNASLTGTDSKGGTIIHEISHFNVVAGTDDIVYGQTGAKSLAVSDPNGATNNADSHEYFAENTPSLD